MKEIANATSMYIDGLLTAEEWKFQVAKAILHLSEDQADTFAQFLSFHMKIDGSFLEPRQ